ncbi:MAG: glutamine amidotransferase [Myxococcales bacterium]|nr:glutamine amidotransferase [Myxococcales bacterium]
MAVLIVQTGTTIPEIRERRGDFDDWIIDGMNLALSDVHVFEAYQGLEAPRATDYQGIVITGSSAMVSEQAAWSERTARWLDKAVSADVPILGICYGHQLLAHALGGTVGKNPNGREIGTVEVILAADAKTDELFCAFDTTLTVHATHRESVVKLPSEATLLASSQADAHHAFVIGKRAWGIQFHPEFDADIMRGYLMARRETLVQEALDPDKLMANVSDRTDGRTVLQRFSAIIQNN